MHQTTFQEKLGSLLDELPNIDALEESRLKKAARYKITSSYSRDTDPNVPIDDTLRTAVDAMRDMFPPSESLSDYDDRDEQELAPYYGERADALIHVDVVWTILDETACDGLLLLFVNNHGTRLTRWRDDLRRFNPPLFKCYNEAYKLLFDLLNKAADLPGIPAVNNRNLDTLLTDELCERIDAIDQRIEVVRARSYLKIARAYRAAIVPFL